MQKNKAGSAAEDATSAEGSTPYEAGTCMDDFTQFQLKEYENISQAHFKTNEVLATFYRYYILITAIPITTIGLALMKLSENEIGDEARILAHFIFGVSALLLSFFGAGVILYIEGLRLDAILYARVVNSIRKYFFNKSGAEQFGDPVLPTTKVVPEYGGYGSSFVIFLICAVMNASYFAAGVLTLMMDRKTNLIETEISGCQWTIASLCLLALFAAQFAIRGHLISGKSKKGF